VIEYNSAGAFLVGLMGAGHCIGMCGGLIGALSQSRPTSPGHPIAKQLGFLLSYNLGRISSYAIAGAMVGGSAAALGTLFSLDTYLLSLRLIAGAMMIAMGLYVAKFWFGLIKIERLGKIIWRRLSPIASRLMPIRNNVQAMMAGVLWGWLPCGLVYSTLTWAVASGSALDGAAIMFCFGLGTLPALLSVGVAAKTLASWVQKTAVRTASGLFLMGYGIHTMYVALRQLV
jgi:uncharacterized protein